MQFPRDFPEKLRSQILVSEVVGKKVKLKQRGKEFMGLCPFHNEKSPSFTVNDIKGFYHCFGCQAHGDVISFVMQNEGLEYAEAVKKLADDNGIAIPQVTKFSANKEEEIDRNYLLLEKVCEFFEKNLQESTGREARNYIAKRGLEALIVKKFRLGFAPQSYDALNKFLAVAGFSEAEILQSGVIAKNDQGKIYDKFRNRVIFPITDKKNRVIAFGGRILDPKDFPKYLNSSETEIFKKNQTLYNFFNARKPIFEKKYAVVVEGYMDVISLVSHGVENVVAGLGTALGENHLRELFAIVDKIVICLDGDAAGLRAAKRVSEIALPLISSKKNISFTFLPSNLDPDDFVKNFGAAELEKQFDNSINMSQALLEFALLDLAIDKNKNLSAEDKAKIEENLTKKITLIKDATTKKYFSLFFKDTLFSMGRSPKSFAKNSNKGAKNSKKNENTASDFGNLVKSVYVKPVNIADNLAKNIIALIIKFPQLCEYKDENFDIKEVNFLNDKLTIIKDLTLEFIDENAEFSTENLLQTLDNADLSPAYNANIVDIKNLLATMRYLSVEYDNSGTDRINDQKIEGQKAQDQISQKMSLLLLKELLLQVDWQYKQSLAKIDEIETYQTTIVNEKIKEIFAYRNSLEQKILELEKNFN